MVNNYGIMAVQSLTKLNFAPNATVTNRYLFVVTMTTSQISIPTFVNEGLFLVKNGVTFNMTANTFLNRKQLIVDTGSSLTLSGANPVLVQESGEMKLQNA